MIAVVIAVVAPFCAAILALLLGHRVRRSVIGIVGAAGAGVAFLAAWAIAGAGLLGDLVPRVQSYAEISTGSIDFHLAFRLDGLTALVALLVASVALAVQLYSIAYLRKDPRYPSYVALISLFTAAMQLVVTADDLLVLLVGWEVMGICSYFLIGHYWERQEARDGAVKAFVVTRLGDIGFLFGIFTLGLTAKTFRISQIQWEVVYGGLDSPVTTVACLLLLCGVIGKSAQFPLHVWLPDAMPGPTPVSALIHAATMVAAGVFLVARLDAVFRLAPIALAVLAILASITMLGAALAALAEDDLKRVLAWSTVSQLGLMFGGLAVGGYSAGLLQLLSHGAFKALLFLGAGVVIHVVGSNLMSAMGGLRHALPITFTTMTVGLMALIGLPPVGGFFSKESILSYAEHAALRGDIAPSWVGWVVLVAALATVAVTAVYATRLWLRVFFGPGSPSRQRISRLMTWPLIVLAIPAIGIGYAALVPETLTRWLSGGTAADGVATLFGTGLVGVQPVTAVIALGLTIATTGVVVGRWRQGAEDPVRLAVPAGFGIDGFYDRAIVRPFRRLARVVVATDRDVVDLYVQGSGRTARALGGLLRLAQNGNIQLYLGLLLAGVVVLAVSAGVVLT